MFGRASHSSIHAFKHSSILYVTFDSSFFPGARSLASRLAFKTEKTLFSLICLVYSNMSKGSLCFSHRVDSGESLLAATLSNEIEQR